MIPGRDSVRRLLVFRIGHLGDTIITLPAFWELRRNFPDAEITLLTNVDQKNPHYLSAWDVLPKQGLFDNYIGYPTNLGPAGRMAAMVKLLARLRSLRFDAGAYFMPRGRSPETVRRDARFFRMAGIPFVFGMRKMMEENLPWAVPYPTPPIQTEARFMVEALADDGLDIDDGNMRSDLLLTPQERDAASNWVAANVPNDHGTLVGIAPNAKWESKIWPEDNFAEAVEALIASHDIYPIVFGGSEDREKAERLIAQWGRGSVAAGELSVRDSAALLERCRLYFGLDTGTMHLAAAVGTPCVSIFAAIDWLGRWLPFGERNTSFRARVDCEGCLSAICKTDGRCLAAISVDDAIDACRRTLDEVTTL